MRDCSRAHRVRGKNKGPPGIPRAPPLCPRLNNSALVFISFPRACFSSGALSARARAIFIPIPHSSPRRGVSWTFVPPGAFNSARVRPLEGPAGHNDESRPEVRRYTFGSRYRVTPPPAPSSRSCAIARRFRKSRSARGKQTQTGR